MDTYNCSSSLCADAQMSSCYDPQSDTTYLEPALILTVSFTCWMVCLPVGTASFFPPREAAISAPVRPIVPSARYSFLMARPRITLQEVRAVEKKRISPQECAYALGHGGRA